MCAALAAFWLTSAELHPEWRCQAEDAKRFSDRLLSAILKWQHRFQCPSPHGLWVKAPVMAALSPAHFVCWQLASKGVKQAAITRCKCLLTELLTSFNCQYPLTSFKVGRVNTPLTFCNFNLCLLWGVRPKGCHRKDWGRCWLSFWKFDHCKATLLPFWMDPVHLVACTIVANALLETAVEKLSSNVCNFLKGKIWCRSFYRLLKLLRI